MKTSFAAYAVVAVGILFAAPANAQEYVFQSNADASDFKDVPVKWRVSGQAYGPVAAASGFTVAVIDKKYKDVSARTTVSRLEAPGMGGVVVRAKRSGAFISGYFGAIQDTGKITAARIIRFDEYNLKQSSGSFEALCTKEIPLEKGKNVELRVRGESIRLFYNGELVCSAKDDEYQRGVVGLFASTHKKASVSFGSASFED